MPRFGVAFRRKSTATEHDYQNGQMAMDQPSSFRVIERTDPVLNKSFDGGARMARSSGTFIPKHSHLDLEDNMFADLKGNRGSGASNTTKATSTDASSRHSNASTAPSSADLAQDESKQHIPRKPLHDVPPRTAPKSSGSGFLNRAGRTFSFGQKKHGSSSPKEDVPDVPPLPNLGSGDWTGRARGLTESTTSTATPPKLEEGGGLDLGGDFGSMFTGFDKRASVMTLKNDGTVAPRSLTSPRSVHPAPLTIDKTSRIDPAPQSWNSRNSNDGLLGSSIPNSPDYDSPPPVPRHQTSFKTSNRPSDIIEDEDAKLLQDSLAAGRLLSNNSYSNSASRYQREEDTFTSLARKPLNSSFNKGDDNMFEGSLAHSSRIAHRYSSRAPSPPRNKVMTPAQFEKYRKDKERNGPVVEAQKAPANDDDDEEDEINYDDDEDEMEKSKMQAKQRRKQEAHMAVYRQQMMKVTGEQPDLNPIERPSLPQSMSAPQLHQIQMKTPSPGPIDDEEDEDEEIPLGILQAHGFPSKNRPPTRLNNMGSNSNLRAASIAQQPRAGSVMGDRDPAPATSAPRGAALPAFARNLPQDPFVGASIARPAVRESLQFSGGAPAAPINPSQSQQSLHPGGLVGVIASEERAKALRRGSPNIDGNKLLPNMNGPAPGFDPIAGIPAHMMYSGNAMPSPGQMPGMPGMGGMPMGGMPGMGAGMLGMGQMAPQPPMLTVGDQAQLQMTAQMSQFMQMQMQFMQMMATNQNQNQLAQPYGGLAATQSMNDLTSRHSMVGEPMMEPPRLMDAGMRTMSMVGPSSASFIQHPGYAGSIRASGMGYAPSIAPSERSNIGLPGRYRPVTQAPSALMPPDNHRRTNTMSGGLSNRWDETKSKSTINVVSKAGDGSDDDDDEGWEAMKAKRERKRTLWRSKKGHSSELSTPMI